MAALTPLERDVVTAFVAGDSPEALALQEQVNFLSVRTREWYGDAGFVTTFEMPSGAPKPNQLNVELTDVIATVEGMGPVQFVLWIVGGQAATLEATSYEPWPTEPLRYSLRYDREPRAQSVLGNLRR